MAIIFPKAQGDLYKCLFCLTKEKKKYYDIQFTLIHDKEKHENGTYEKQELVKIRHFFLKNDEQKQLIDYQFL